jgi:hypothetical protein
MLGTLLAGYAIYVLMLGKLFAASVTPPWYRDIGILWDLADYTISHSAYPAGYYFPPSNAIIVYLYGLLDRDLAFRLYLVIQVVAVAMAIWAWMRLTETMDRPPRLPVVLTALLSSFVYVHMEFHMHNLNAVTFALVSLSLAYPRRIAASSGCYALALAVKPYSSVLIAPWMAWRGERAWAASAFAWLLGFYVILPAVWFGPPKAVRLYGEWLTEVFQAATNDDPNQTSVRAGVAALTGLAWDDPRLYWAVLALQAIWLGALAAFFLLVRQRRGYRAAAQCEAAAILLAGQPLGGLQQPARGIVLLAPTLLIASAIFAPAQARGSRIALIAVLFAMGVLAQLVPLGPIFFLLTVPVCLLALLGLAIVRASPPRATE